MIDGDVMCDLLRSEQYCQCQESRCLNRSILIEYTSRLRVNFPQLMKTVQLTLRRFDWLDDDNNKEHSVDADRKQGLVDTIVTGAGGIENKKGNRGSRLRSTEIVADVTASVGGSVTAATLRSRRDDQK